VSIYDRTVHEYDGRAGDFEPKTTGGDLNFAVALGTRSDQNANLINY